MTLKAADAMGRLDDVAAMVGGQLHGTDAFYAGVSTDTRTLVPGDLYVALTGPNFDGHAFVADAARGGAAGALVAALQDVPLAQVSAGNTRRSLARFAAAWRDQFDLPVVGVTGSNGKTTVKQMLAAIFGHSAPVLATRGNLNNDIGVPLTLLRLRAEHRAAVVEMGASGPAEIGELAALARPRVGIVNNAMAAHLEGFGSLDEIARTKGAMYSALPEDGVAIINRDDAYYDAWCRTAGSRRIISFGQSAAADVTLRDVRQTLTPDGPWLHVRVRAFGHQTDVRIPAAGAHNARNALAAIAAALACEVSLEQCADGLAEVRMAAGRLEVVAAPHGGFLINDSYNANPASLRAAVDFVCEQSSPAWLVLGDMGELGPDEQAEHAAAGAYARAAGIQRLYAVGELSRQACASFGADAHWHASMEALVDALRRDVPAGVNLLFKGSRSARLERAFHALRAPLPENC